MNNHLKSIFTICLLLVALTSLTHAQEASTPQEETRREFQNVDHVLDWARDAFGCGFIYDRAHLIDERGKPLALSYLGPKDPPNNPTLTLFECLRSIGLVAMQAEGLEGPVYHVLPVDEAAAYADIAYSTDQLEGSYFGSLALEAQSIELEKLEEIVKRFSSKHAQVTALNDTSVIIVSDFVDHLMAIAQASTEAQIPATRDDDTVTESFKAREHDPASLRLAVEDARRENERYTLTLHEPSQTLLLSGTRKDVATALQRLELLDESELAPQATTALHVIDLNALQADKAALALREFFAEDIERLLVRIVPAEIKRQVLIECTQSRYKAALNLMNQLDPKIGLLRPGEERPMEVEEK